MAILSSPAESQGEAGLGLGGGNEEPEALVMPLSGGHAQGKGISVKRIGSSRKKIGDACDVIRCGASDKLIIEVATGYVGHGGAGNMDQWM